MQDQAKKQGLFATLLRYAGGQKGKLRLAVVLSVISVGMGLVPYYCFYRIIALFLLGAASARAILGWGLGALLAYVVKVVCFGFSTINSHVAAYHILENLRLEVASRFLRASLGDVTSHSIGQIKGVLVDKIEGMEPPIAHMIPEGSGHLVLPVVSLIALLCVDWRLALASLVTLPLSLFFMGLTMKISGKNFEKYNTSNAQMNSNIVEYVEGIEVIKAFGRAGVSYEKYASAIQNYKTFVVRWMSSTWVPMKLAFALFPSTLLGVLPVSLALCVGGAITAAQAALAVMLAMSMVTSLAQLEVFANEIKKVELTLDELREYLEMPPLPEAAQPATLRGYDVALRDVHFGYGGAEVLHGVSLSMPQGSFTALVGPSGGGKSTVARLISRFYEVGAGEITIGGVNIKDIPPDQLADTISFVAQDNFLFRCSLRENIRMGKPSATDEEVLAAAKAAQCDGFIQKLPQGYDTPAGEAGKRLSGGEKQRIAIARMMLKNAPIVVLDEATAFTDPENEDKIQKSMMSLARGKTLLVIAHRLSTIKNADNIVVLQDGAVAAQGTQAELLAGCPLYQRMWQAHIGAKNWAVSTQKEACHV